MFEPNADNTEAKENGKKCSIFYGSIFDSINIVRQRHMPHAVAAIFGNSCKMERPNNVQHHHHHHINEQQQQQQNRHNMAVANDANNLLYKALQDKKQRDAEKRNAIFHQNRTIMEARMQKQLAAGENKSVVSACSSYANNMQYVRVNSGQEPGILLRHVMHPLNPDECDVYASLVMSSENGRGGGDDLSSTCSPEINDAAGTAISLNDERRNCQMMAMHNHCMNSEGDIEGFRFTCSESDLAARLPMGRKLFFRCSMVECLDDEDDDNDDDENDAHENDSENIIDNDEACSDDGKDENDGEKAETAADDGVIVPAPPATSPEENSSSLLDLSVDEIEGMMMAGKKGDENAVSSQMHEDNTHVYEKVMQQKHDTFMMAAEAAAEAEADAAAGTQAPISSNGAKREGRPATTKPSSKQKPRQQPAILPPKAPGSVCSYRSGTSSSIRTATTAASGAAARHYAHHPQFQQQQHHSNYYHSLRQQHQHHHQHMNAAGIMDNRLDCDNDYNNFIDDNNKRRGKDKNNKILRLLLDQENVLKHLLAVVQRIQAESVNKEPSFSCMPENTDIVNGATDAGPSSERHGASAYMGNSMSDCKDWNPELPEFVGLYHAWVRGFNKDTRVHKLFIVTSGGCTSMCDSFFNLFSDVKHEMTAREILDSEEVWYMRQANHRNNARILYEVAKEFGLKIPTNMDVYSYEPREMAAVTTETLHHDIIQDHATMHRSGASRRKISLLNRCMDTRMCTNGILSDLHPPEGVWLFKGPAQTNSGSTLYGGSFGDGGSMNTTFPIGTSTVHPHYSWNSKTVPGSPVAQKHACFVNSRVSSAVATINEYGDYLEDNDKYVALEKYTYMHEEYLQALQQDTRWNRDNGIIELIPIAVVRQIKN